MIGIVVLFLVVYIVYVESMNGPTDDTNAKGYPGRKESTSKILDRMEWMALRHDRVRYLTKFLLWGLWITFFCSFLFLERLPNMGIFFRNWLVVTITLLCLSGFYYFHSDKFSEYAILKGIGIIRERLGIKAGDLELLSSNTEKLKGHEAPFVFTTEDYTLGSVYPIS